MTPIRTVVPIVLAAVAGMAPIARAQPAEPAPAPAPAPPGMTWIPAGAFTMGGDRAAARSDEFPIHRVRLDGYWIDTNEVTNAQFRAFVEATGHVTTAEQKPDLEEIRRQLAPGVPMPPEDTLVPAALVFAPPARQPLVVNVSQWWSWVPGADWRHPTGPDSTIEGLDDHPVVNVSWDDAAAYAAWAGKRLPTEAEWERAARGSLDRAAFVWGDEPVAASRANLWQGAFPNENLASDGFPGTAPVGSFPPNGFGLHDVAGNVWEWCADWYRPDTYRTRVIAAGGGVVENPTGPEDSLDPRNPGVPARVTRGGSFLCHASYSTGYRPSARQPVSPDTPASHTGFRCVIDGAAWAARSERSAGVGDDGPEAPPAPGE